MIADLLVKEITKETGIDAVIYDGNDTMFTKPVLIVMPYQYSFGRQNDSANKKSVTVYYNIHWSIGVFENDLEVMSQITHRLHGARYDVDCSTVHLGFLAFSMLELARTYEYEMYTGKIKLIEFKREGYNGN